MQHGASASKPRFLFWRALGAFLLLPGVVAFLGPWLLRPEGATFRPIGFAPLGVGIVLLLWCVRDFYVVGKGTLAPWAPPEQLVIVGLYRVTRNPMYVAVLLILCGWALGFASRGLWIYAAIVAIAVHVRVVLQEEPWLTRRHGEAYVAYKAKVPRWLV
ncbi:MAG TPA: isoprenylcysteine carboxylmethyltransferase family protein [Gemmatimonadaceae bacterium]|nr:isoprenylcysteine carboxylmethyltransferase family protein [Gemmatimonadaceae bacterium]